MASTTTLRDKPRPPGFWPNTPSQWREPTVDDCTWYATEAAFQSAGEPHLNFHPVRDIRSQSTDTQGGTPISVALRDTAAFWPKICNAGYMYGIFEKDEIKRSLLSGAALVVGGDYEKLPLHYRRWTNNDVFDHAIMHKFLLDTDFTFMYDPLGGGSERDEYDGEWIHLSKLYGQDGFAWKNARGFYVGIVENTREDQMINAVTVEPNAATVALLVKKNTKVYKTPSTVAPIERTIWSDNKLWPTVAKGQNGWRLIVWPDNDTGATRYGWVAKADIEEVVDVPVLGNNQDNDAEMAAMQTKLESCERLIRDIQNRIIEAEWFGEIPE